MLSGGGRAVWRRRGCLEEEGLTGGQEAGLWRRRGCLDGAEEEGLSGGGGVVEALNRTGSC